MFQNLYMSLCAQFSALRRMCSLLFRLLLTGSVVIVAVTVAVAACIGVVGVALMTTTNNLTLSREFPIF